MFSFDSLKRGLLLMQLINIDECFIWGEKKREVLVLWCYSIIWHALLFLLDSQNKSVRGLIQKVYSTGHVYSNSNAIHLILLGLLFHRNIQIILINLSTNWTYSQIWNTLPDFTTDYVMLSVCKYHSPHRFHLVMKYGCK